MGTVAGLVLAAGAGRRLGSPKALLRIAGETLVDRAVGLATKASCAPVVVVLGCSAEQVRQAASLEPATVVVNGAWSTGMGSSLRVGLEGLADHKVDAAVVLLVDMPGVTPAAVSRVAALATPQALVVATYGGRRGHPILLGREHWPGICRLAQLDVGARPYLVLRGGQVQQVPCDDVGDDGDVDTPDDAERYGVEIPAELGVRPGGPA